MAWRALRLLSLLILLPSLAGAAEIVAVPDGESETLWVELVATAEDWTGGVRGTVAIRDHGVDRWLVTTRDSAGSVHRVVVEVPTDDDGRMELAMLGVSLLQPPRTVARPAMRALPAAPIPDPEPEPSPVVIAPPPAPTPAAPQRQRGAFAASLGVYASIGGSLEIEDKAIGAGTVSVDSGVRLPAGVRVAVRVTLDGEFGVADVAVPGSLPPLRLTAGGMVAWAGSLPISPLVGVGGGARWNVARAPDELFGARRVSPQLDVLVGLSINPPGWLRVEPMATLRVGSNVDLFGSPSAPPGIELALHGGVQVTMLSVPRQPLPIDRSGR